MYKHYLIILEEYDHEGRLAFHMTITEKKDLEKIELYEEDLTELSIGFYTHLITTSKDTIQSIKEKDSFFENVTIFEKYFDFKNVAKSPHGLNAMDIARYILMLKPTTPLKLQKLLYIVYERYFLNRKIELFKERFLAFDYGPVVKEVYSVYRGQSDVLTEKDDQSVYSVISNATTPITYKIFREEDSEYISSLIKDVIDEYDGVSAWDMVEKTHKKNTAWDKAYKLGQNSPITVDLIKSSVPVK